MEDKKQQERVELMRLSSLIQESNSNIRNELKLKAVDLTLEINAVKIGTEEYFHKMHEYNSKMQIIEDYLNNIGGVAKSISSYH